jgi:hypothetical protein
VGDSTGLVIGDALMKFGQQSGRLVSQAVGKGGCGFIAAVRARYRPGLEEERHCGDLVPSALRAAATLKPNVILLTLGYPDMGDLRLPGDDRWRHIGDPVVDRAYRVGARAALTAISNLGVPVVWLDTPDADWNPDKLFGAPLAGGGTVSLNDPARAHRINQLAAEVVRSFPLVSIVRFAAQLGRDGTDSPKFNPAVRFDGLHLAPAKALDFARGWLGDQLLKAYVERTPRPSPSA